jgi:hypothetical protein
VEGTQTCVLAGETSTAGDVDDETELTLELRELDQLARDGPRIEIVQAGHGGSFVKGMNVIVTVRA